MSTVLRKSIKREITIDGVRYTVCVTADGVYLSRKRFRTGQWMGWRDLRRLGASSEAPVVNPR